jgi:thiol-disulfide isomerase/thioredoxin
LPDPILLWGRSGRVDSVPPTALLERADGGIDVADGTRRTYLGDLRPEGNEIVMAYDGRDVRLRLRPPLVGSHDLDELLDHSPDYVAGLSAYTPDAEAIRRLEELVSGVRVRIFFGSWCGACKHYLPRALRVERELASSPIRFQHYGLDDPPAGWEDAEVKENRVTSLPTAIVYRGDEELGRLVGPEDFAEPERTLLDIVGGG